MRLLFGFVYHHFNSGKPKVSIHVHANLHILQLHKLSMSLSLKCKSAFSFNASLHLALYPSLLLSYSFPQVNRVVGSKVSASLWIKWRGEWRVSQGCRGGDEAVGLTRARHDDLPQCVSQLAWVTLMKAHTEPNIQPWINKVILTRVSSKISSFFSRKKCAWLSSYPYCHIPLCTLQISQIWRSSLGIKVKIGW